MKHNLLLKKVYNRVLIKREEVLRYMDETELSSIENEFINTHCNKCYSGEDYFLSVPFRYFVTGYIVGNLVGQSNTN